MTNFMKDSILAAISVALTFLFGSFDTILIVLCAFIIFDFIFGTIKGYVQKNLSSTFMYRGIAKKVGELFIVAVAYQIDKLTGNGDFLIRTMVCYFYIANEGLSIIENAVAIGVPVPEIVKEALEMLAEKSEKE